MTAPIASGDPMVALAAMLVDRDYLRATVDDENLRAARDDQRRELAQQLSDLHAAADDIRVGAFVEGGLAIGGAALSTVGAELSCESHHFAHELLTGSGGGLHGLAAPAGNMLGNAPRADAEAQAKRAETAASDAAGRAEEAQHHRERVDQSTDRALDTITATLASEAQGNLAIISNV